MKRMPSGKSPGPDNIPYELIQHGGLPLKSRLFILVLRMWESEQVPKDLKDAAVITISVKKGDRNACGNYRGISLLSIAGKILARILLNRLQVVAEEILPESQCFRQARGTIDMIFCARQIQEKGREQQKPLFFVFYDLEKAFDKVPRTAMSMVLRRLGSRTLRRPGPCST